MDMSPIDFVSKFSAMGHQPFTAEELLAAEAARLIGCHGPNLTYQLTELGVAMLEAEMAAPCFGTPAERIARTRYMRNKVSAPTPAKDVQVGGDHYKTMGDYQPFQVAAEWLTPEELRGYMKGTVIAYLAREKQKGGDQDIAKSLHFIQLFEELRKDKPCK